MWIRIATLTTLCAAFMLAADFAQAQESVARIDQVPDAFRGAVEGVAEKLSVIARNLLLSLLVIELIWKLGQTVMDGQDFGAIMGVFFKRVIVAGLFLALIDGIPTGSGSVGISTFIIESAEALTEQSVGTKSLKPSDLFWDMHSSGREIYYNSKGIVGSIFGGLVWLIICVLSAMIVGMMIVAYIEIYVVFTVGILALGFGAWSVTEHFARNFLFSAVGKIFKLFTLILMASVISLSIQGFGSITSVEDGLIVVAIEIIFALLMGSVPVAIEQVVSGMSQASADGAVASKVAAPGQSAANTAGRGAKAGVKALARPHLEKAGKALSKAKGGISDRIKNIKGGG